MAAGEGMDLRSYEVHCPRCSVTFPIETKRCIHCGGATGNAAASPFEVAYGIDDGRSETPLEEDEIVLGEVKTPTGKSILSSMGGLLWVLLIIGFSLARSCGGG